MKKVSLVIAFVALTWMVSGQSTQPQLGDYVVDRKIGPNNQEIIGVMVPGRPPDNYRAPVISPTESAITLQNVPAFSWCFGCSATSAAMMAGYYDNSNYPDIYTGPTNGGIVPMNNAVWGSVIINGEQRDQCPLSATRQGIDGRATRGHVDDYWIAYGNAGPDPYITNGWTEHTWDDCTADFMGTSQSAFGCTDGGTIFYYDNGGSPLNDYTGCEPGQKDGCHGMRQFFESRGYSVLSNYTQLIYGYNGNTQGFTFDQYMAEIDNGRPVLIQVSGHTMLGYGYDDATQTIYLHDTWDYNNHAMTWGGSYSGMDQYAVTCITLEPQNPVSTVNPVALFSSVNVYTLLMTEQTCITYNPEIDAIMFTARGHTGVLGTGNDICTATSVDGGTSFVNNVTASSPSQGNNRFPSGAIYNPVGNANPINAKKVFVAPINNGSGWAGNNFATNNWDNSALYSTVQAANPDGELLLRGGLNVDCNGIAHTSGVVLNSSTSHSYIYRGVYISSYGGFSWTPQELSVPFYMSPNGVIHATTVANVAFSPDGSIGYAMFIGSDARGASPTGIQPIVYKTINNGTTWSLMGTLNIYNNPVMSQYITPVQGTSNYVPYFDETDMVVDYQGNLHIISLCRGTASTNPEQLNGYNAGDKGAIFDVVVSAQGGGCVVRYINAPETDLVPPEESGYGTGATAIGWGHRLQASRSADGKVIIAIWTDTDFEFFGEEINLYPDICGQAHRVTDSYNSPVVDFTNQGYTYGENYFHFVSPVCITDGLNYTIPVTKSDIRTTNDPGQAVYHSYLQGITFTFPEENNLVTIGTGSIAVNYPYYTLYHDGRMQIVITADELTAAGASAGMVDRLQFNVSTVNPALQNMNGFEIKMKETSQSSVSSFENVGWTTVYSGTELITETGWNNKDFQLPFYWNGIYNLMIEVCFDNTSYSSNSIVYGTTVTNKTWHRHSDNQAGCAMTAGTIQSVRPNVRLGFDLSYQPVVASFTATPSTGNAPLTVTFNNTSQGNNVAYVWDFGDPTSGALNSSTLVNPIHTYNTNGTYVVTLFATDSTSHDSHVQVINMIENNSLLLPPVNLQGSVASNNATLTWMAPGSFGTVGKQALDITNVNQQRELQQMVTTEYKSDGSSAKADSFFMSNSNKSSMALQFTYNLQTLTGEPGFVGAASDGQYLYATRWSSDTIYKLTLNGILVEKFFISSVTNLRDLAYDGQYFYGGSATYSIFKMDFTNHMLISTITSPVSVRSLSYDSQNDAFWVNNWDSQLTLVGRSGTVLQTVPQNPPSLYGTAYDEYSAGGPFLWCFTGTLTNGGCQVEQLSLASGQLTGISHSVSNNLGGGIAGGLFIYPDLVSGTITLGGVMQAETAPNQLFGYDMNAPAAFDTLMGYNLYRNGNLLAYIEAPTTTYSDNNLPNGSFQYEVTAVYNNGESVAEGPVNITVGLQNPAPLTLAASVGTPNNSNVTLPITVEGFSNITALSLRLDYDPNLLVYQGYSNVNSQLQGIFINMVPLSPNLYKIITGWSNSTPQTLQPGSTLFDLNFTYLGGGTAELAWNNESNVGSDCEYADAVGDPLTDQPTDQFYHNGFIYYQPGYNISGVATYDNSASTPLDNVSVKLMQNQIPIDSVQTDAGGGYQFTGIQNGNYSLQGSSTKPWLGVNATDAVKIERHFTGLEPLNTPVKTDAADVNLSFMVNATDALKLKRRFVNLDNSFLRGNWTFNSNEPGGTSLVVDGSDVTKNISGLCVGDVNGSNFPLPGKEAGQRVNLTTSGLLLVAAGETFSVPVTLSENLRPGGVSLVIDYPPSLVKVVGVEFLNPGAIIAITDHQIRIAWSALEPLNLKAGEPLLVITMSGVNPLPCDLSGALSAGIESEFADDQGNVFTAVGLTIPEIRFKEALGIQESGLPAIAIYPNPVDEKLTMTIHTSEPQQLTVDLLDATGRRMVETLRTTEKELNINTTHLAAGVYILRVTSTYNDRRESVFYKIIKN